MAKTYKLGKWFIKAQGAWKNIDNAFNGETGGSSYSEIDTTTDSSTISFTGLTGLSSLRLYANITNPSPVVKVNQTDVSSSLSTSGQWVDVSGALSGGALNSLEVTTTSGAFYLYEVEADGAALVNAGAQWDTSKIWSKGVTSGRPLNIGTEAQMFDGVLPVSSR